MSVYKEMQGALNNAKKRSADRKSAALAVVTDLYNRFIVYVKIPHGRYASLLAWDDRKQAYLPFKRDEVVAPPYSVHRLASDERWQFGLFIRLNDENIASPEGAMLTPKFYEVPGGYMVDTGFEQEEEVFIDPDDVETFGPLFKLWAESIIGVYDRIWPDSVHEKE